MNPAHPLGVKSLTFIDEKMIISAGVDNKIIVWSL